MRKLLLLLLVGLWACLPAPDTNESATDPLPSRRDLFRAARNAEVWRVLYCPGEAGQESAYQDVLAGLVAARPFDRQIDLLHCDSIHRLRQLAGQPLIFVGSRLPDISLPNADLLPVQVLDAGFRVFGETFTDPQDLITLAYTPSPADPQQPFHLFYAVSDSFLLASLREDYAGDWGRAFWSSWGYRVTQAGHTRYLGFLDEEHWTFNADQHFHFSREPAFIGRSAHYAYYAWDDAPAEALPLVREKLEQDYARVAAFAEREADEPVRVYFYPSVERMGLRRDDMLEAQYSVADRSMHLVCNDAFKGELRGDQIALWLELWFGEPLSPWLREGLAAHLTGTWAGQGATYWAARLYQSDNLPALADLFAPERRELISPLVRSAVSGALVDWLLRDRGAALLREKNLHWLPGAPETAQLERELRGFLREQSVSIPPVRPVPDEFLRGMTFAHEGYRVFNGYGGRLAKASLDSLGTLGVNAISIVPYSSMRGENSLTPFLRDHRAGSENDQAVMSSALYARAKGWFVLLKPQIWIRGSWPGGVEFATQAEWDQFHDYYYQWILHYALLSEIYQLDGLCLGTEFVKATLQHPGQWRSIAGRVRGLYRGVLTYAANWGQEFEQFPLWESFDAAGLNAYYPLGETLTISDDSLRLAARRMLEEAAARAARYGKPLWLTEIGYRNVEGPWRNPHAEANGRPPAPEHQARAYRALLQAQAETGAAGAVFWWKWPSYLGYSQGDDTGFAVRGKPGEAVLREYWLKRVR